MAHFSELEINKGRQYEFDLVKALTIILMIWTHVYESFSTGFEPSLSFANAYWRGGIFGATTFMFCMGIGMVYTRSSTPHDYFKRGLHIFYTGLLLGFFRFTVAGIISGRFFAAPKSAAYMVLEIGSDILLFAGLAFLLMAFLRKTGLRYRHILMISVALSLLSYFLEGVNSNNFFVNQAMGYFWGNDSQSYFPLFNWFIFVAAGGCFGKMYLHLQDKNWFHRICFPVGLAVTVAYFLICFNADQNIFRQFDDELWLAHRMLPDAVMTILANVWLISLFFYIAKLIPQKAIPTLTHPSKHINQYYCISWFWIYLVRFSISTNRMLNDDPSTMIAWCVALIITIATILVYNKWLKEKFDAFFGKHHTFWVVFIVVATLASTIYGYYLCDGHYPTFHNGYTIQ